VFHYGLIGHANKSIEYVSTRKRHGLIEAKKWRPVSLYLFQG
jgi:hypothetical protein